MSNQRIEKVFNDYGGDEVLQRTVLMLLLLTLVLCLSPSAIAEEIHITFQTSVYVEAPHKAALDLLVEAYKEVKPNVTIEIYGAPYGNYWDRLTVEVMSGTQADIVQVYPPDIAKYHVLAPGGAFVDLTDWIVGTELENLIFQEECVYEGQHLAISNYAWGATGLFYRKSLLEAAGIDPQQIVTLNDLADALVATTLDLTGDGRIDQYGMGIVLGTHPFVFTEWAGMVARPISGGVFFADNEKGPYVAERVNANHPANVWAAEFWQDLLFEKQIAPEYAPDKLDAREYFWAGRAAFNMDGPWFIGMTREQDPTVLDDTGLIANPVIEYEGEIYPGGSRYSPIVHMLSKNASHPEEAWEFMVWMTSLEAQELIAVSGMIPSNPAYSETDEYRESFPMAASFVDFMQGYNMANNPPIPELGELQEIIIDACQQMFIRGLDPQMILDQAAADMKAVME